MSTDIHQMTALLSSMIAQTGVIGKTGLSLWGLRCFEVGDTSPIRAIMVVFFLIKA